MAVLCLLTNTPWPWPTPAEAASARGGVSPTRPTGVASEASDFRNENYGDTPCARQRRSLSGRLGFLAGRGARELLVALALAAAFVLRPALLAGTSLLRNTERLIGQLRGRRRRWQLPSGSCSCRASQVLPEREPREACKRIAGSKINCAGRFEDLSGLRRLSCV